MMVASVELGMGKAVRILIGSFGKNQSQKKAIFVP